MASKVYEQILAVQDLDLAITRLRYQIEHHELRVVLAEIDERLAANATEADEVGERRHELEREQKRLEDEIALISDKRSEIETKLYGGEVTASKELLALQDESAMLLERQTELEDQDLEIMERVESVDAELGLLSATRSTVEAERDGHQQEIAAAIGDLEQELAELTEQRVNAAGSANDDLLARYEELRGQYDGVAVARLNNGSCDGCHIQLSAVAADQMAKMADDAVVTCEECGRLLVR